MDFVIKFFIVLLIIVILFLLFFLYAIKPGKHRDTEYFKHKLYAHRGLHDKTVPENSLTAFRLASEQGYGVELDVQMTSDGKLVVFHDGNLKRMCGADIKLKTLTYEELLKYRLKDTDEIIPLFSDVLKVLGTADLICEIKADNGNRNYDLCAKVYDELEGYAGRYCIESFSPFIVKWFRLNHPEIIRGQLSCCFKDSKGMAKIMKFFMSDLLINMLSRPDFVAYKHEDTHVIGFKLCRALYRPFLVAWTAKGDEQIESARKTFDAVIFEKDPPKST